MNKIKKIFIVMICSFVLGLSLMFVGSKLGGKEYLKNTNIENFTVNESDEKFIKKELEDFSNININIKDREFQIRKSENEKAYIEYKEYVTEFINFEVKDENFRFSESKNSGVMKVGVDFNINKIKDAVITGDVGKDYYDVILYLPEKEYNDVNIRSTGKNIDVKYLNAKNFEMKSSIVHLKLKNYKVND